MIGNLKPPKMKERMREKKEIIERFVDHSIHLRTTKEI